MSSPQEKPGAESERPKFLAVPEHMRIWSQIGPRFWGGVVAGIGFGYFVALILAEVESLPILRSRVVGVLFLLLIPIGVAVARRTVAHSRREP
jgi:hypothetical protein